MRPGPRMSADMPIIPSRRGCRHGSPTRSTTRRRPRAGAPPASSTACATAVAETPPLQYGDDGPVEVDARPAQPRRSCIGLQERPVVGQQRAVRHVQRTGDVAGAAGVRLAAGVLELLARVHHLRAQLDRPAHAVQVDQPLQPDAARDAAAPPARARSCPAPAAARPPPGAQPAVEHERGMVPVAAQHPHDAAGEHVAVVVVRHHRRRRTDAQPGRLGGELVRPGDRHRHRRRAVGEVVAPVGEHGTGQMAGLVALGVRPVARLAVDHLTAHVQQAHRVEVLREPLHRERAGRSRREWYKARPGPWTSSSRPTRSARTTRPGSPPAGSAASCRRPAANRRGCSADGGGATRSTPCSCPTWRARSRPRRSPSSAPA